MSKIGQYIVDNDIVTESCLDTFSPPTEGDAYFEGTEGDKLWDSVREWKDLCKDDPILF